MVDVTGRKAFERVRVVRERVIASREAEMREYASLLSMKCQAKIFGFDLPWLFVDEARFVELEAKYGTKISAENL